MLEELAQRARRLLRPGERAIVGITGCPGAGKSTLAERLARELNATSVPAAYVPMDGFHLADGTLSRLRRLHRKGAIDTFDGHGYLAMLRRLHGERVTTVYAPAFDRTLEQPIAAAIAVDPSVDVVVTEGNYLLGTVDPWPQVRSEMSEVWYCDLDAAVRRERLVTRHVRFGKSGDEARRWVDNVDEPNARLIELTRDRADLVIDMRVIGRAG